MDTREWGNRKVTYPTAKDIETRYVVCTMLPTFFLAAVLAAKLFRGVWFYLGFVGLWLVLALLLAKFVTLPIMKKYLKKNPWIK